MPRYFLQQNKINPEKDFKRVAYSGADATGIAGRGREGRKRSPQCFCMGQARAGEESRYHQSKGYLHHTAVFRLQLDRTRDLDPELVKKLTAAFLKLDAKNPAHKEIMDLQRASNSSRPTPIITRASRRRRAKRVCSNSLFRVSI
jgi:phosphonate transport system substrate-binding protein